MARVSRRNTGPRIRAAGGTPASRGVGTGPNREAILAVIQPLFAACEAVLEIGSGTGQHAVYFAEKLPHLIWQASDCEEHHAGINLWLEEAALTNTPPPLVLNVAQPDWPRVRVDAVFSANTAHIMHWDEVEAFFAGVGRLLPEKGLFALYGPFNYDHRYTSDGNARFDDWLKSRDPLSGIRDFGDLNRLAERAGMALKQDYAMPANNRILCWEKTGGVGPRRPAGSDPANLLT